MTIDEQEQYLIEAIDSLRRGYEAATRPYIDRLVMLRSLRPAPPIWITIDKIAGTQFCVIDPHTGKLNVPPDS